MNNGPFSAFTNPYTYWFHDTTTICLAVTGFIIHMKAG